MCMNTIFILVEMCILILNNVSEKSIITKLDQNLTKENLTQNCEKVRMNSMED